MVSGGSAPATSLVAQAGGKTAYDESRGHFALAEVPDGVLVAGEVKGKGELESALRSGTIAGAEAAHALGFGDAASRARLDGERERHRPDAWPAPVAVPPPVTSERKGKCFACLCEDVTAKDIHLSVEEGYDSIELSKRYTTTTMGPCQGRMCQLPAVRLMAQETGTSLSDVGTTTRAAALARGADGRAGRAPVRAGQAQLDPRAPPRARRERDVGGRLAPRLRLRRPEGRGDGGAQGGRADRRLHARQADRARAGRGRVPRPALPEPLLQPEARAASATA